MTKTRRMATVVLMSAAAMMAGARAYAQDEPNSPEVQDATIVLHAVNYAALSRDVLDVAKARGAMVYEAIGVRIEWVDGEVRFEQRKDGRRHFSVLLLSRNMADKKISAEGITDGVFGQAHSPSGRAAIFCDRIRTAPGALQHFGNSLGNIIAHEVGHLLLGPNSHSRSGIMRANVDLRARHLQTFEKAQAQRIRTMLRELAADPHQMVNALSSKVACCGRSEQFSSR